MIKISSDFVTNIAYIKSTNEMAKLVIKTKEICNKSRVIFHGFEFVEKHNYIEPYERKAHVFYIPLSLLKEKTSFTFVFTNCCKKSEFSMLNLNQAVKFYLMMRTDKLTAN